MDQVGKGTVVSHHCLSGSAMCALQAFLRDRDLCGAGRARAFVGPLGRGFLSKFQFVHVFRKYLSKMGIVAKKYSSHSFRIGVAS